MDAELYARLINRCRGRCECQCGVAVPPGEVDHFFSRGRSDESEQTCWVLSVRCHYAKTNGSPSSAEWFKRFIRHCLVQELRVIDPRPFNGGPYIDRCPEENAWREVRKRAEARLYFVETRGAFGTALGARR